LNNQELPTIIYSAVLYKDCEAHFFYNFEDAVTYITNAEAPSIYHNDNVFENDIGYITREEIK